MSRPGYIKIANDIGASDEALDLDAAVYLESLGLLILCLGYCDRQLTDGRIPARAVSRAIAPGVECAAALAELERVGFIEENGNGWVIPNYLKWQRSREQVEAASIAGSKAAGTRWGNANRNANRNAVGNAKELDRQIDTEPAREAQPVDKSGKPRRKKKEPVPAYDLVPLMGPITRLIGRQRIPEALDDAGDLNHAIRRYLAAVDALVDANLGELHGARLDTARERCRYESLNRIKSKPDNPAAYLTAAAGNATCLGDLVGDDTVTELRKPKKGRA